MLLMMFWYLSIYLVLFLLIWHNKNLHCLMLWFIIRLIVEYTQLVGRSPKFNHISFDKHLLQYICRWFSFVFPFIFECLLFQKKKKHSLFDQAEKRMPFVMFLVIRCDWTEARYRCSERIHWVIIMRPHAVCHIFYTSPIYDLLLNIDRNREFQ